jgi:hypothetical protein
VLCLSVLPFGEAYIFSHYFMHHTKPGQDYTNWEKCYYFSWLSHNIVGCVLLSWILPFACGKDKQCSKLHSWSWVDNFFWKHLKAAGLFVTVKFLIKMKQCCFIENGALHKKYILKI